MKSVMALWCFVVAIFVLLGLGFAYIFQQQQVSSAAMREVLGKAATYDAALQKIDGQIKTHDGDIKTLQSALANGGDTKGLNEKVDSLVQQVNEVKAQLQDVMKLKDLTAAPGAPLNTMPAPAAPTPDAGTGATSSSVELGTIPVQK